MPIASDTLLSDLRAVASDLQRTPTFREYDDRGKYGACTIQRRYGNWNGALRAAGLDPTQERGIAAETLLADLRRVASELGETPRVTDYKDLGEYGDATLRERFGGWNAALRAAGLDVRRRREITREDVAQDIRRVASDLQRAPSVSEYTDRGQYSVSTAVDRFGSWGDAKAAHDLVLVTLSVRGKYHAIEAMDPPEAACSVGPSGSGSARFVGRSRAEEHRDPCRLCFPAETPGVEPGDDLREAVASASTARDVAEELRIPYEEARRQLDRCGLLDRLLTAEEIIERETAEAAEAD